MRRVDCWENGRLRTAYERVGVECLIERLSNWQRKRWVRAGCPRDEESIKRFGRLQRDGSELYQGEIIAPTAE